MTPAATTPAARATTKKRPAATAGSGGATVPGHRRSVVSRTGAATRPRRVSGPATAPRPQRAPSAPPRRISSPVRRPAGTRTGASIGARILTGLRQLPDHALLDRLVRGRVWIALLGMMLAGIVAMQVEVLKLGASMGRSIDRTTMLQSRNETLRASVAQLADDQRIELLAAKQGMVMPAPANVAFLPAGGAAAVERAISAIHPPAASTFLTATTASGAVTTGANSLSTDPTAGASSATSGITAAAVTSGTPATISTVGSTSSTGH